MRKIILLFFILLFLPFKSNACFGPELIIGYEHNDIENYINSIILELYIKEKTGVGTKIIPISLENIPNLVQNEKIDIFFSGKPINMPTLTKKIFTLDKKYSLYFRTKINEDLRFTTVMEAIEKISKKINSQDIIRLAEKTKTEKQERRLVKEFLIKRGLW